MDKEYIKKLPTWYITKNYYDLCLSNDTDSLLTAIFLSYLKGWQINYFYDFNKLYKTNTAGNNAVAVDIDLTQGKCLSNHPTMISLSDYYNSKAINLNIIDKINCSNYFNKYCLSTILSTLSLYSININEFTEEAQMVLLAVDSGFLGYYSRYKNDNNANKYYLCDVLQYPELYELQQKHGIQDFYDIQQKYNIKNGTIWVDENKHLQTDIDLAGLSKVFFMPIALPKQEFTCIREFKNTSLIIPQGKTTLNKDSIFSLAITGRKYISASFY